MLPRRGSIRRVPPSWRRKDASRSLAGRRRLTPSGSSNRNQLITRKGLTKMSTTINNTMRSTIKSTSIMEMRLLTKKAPLPHRMLSSCQRRTRRRGARLVARRIRRTTPLTRSTRRRTKLHLSLPLWRRARHWTRSRVSSRNRKL